MNRSCRENFDFLIIKFDFFLFKDLQWQKQPEKILKKNLMTTDLCNWLVCCKTPFCCDMGPRVWIQMVWIILRLLVDMPARYQFLCSLSKAGKDSILPNVVFSFYIQTANRTNLFCHSVKIKWSHANKSQAEIYFGTDCFLCLKSNK